MIERGVPYERLPRWYRDEPEQLRGDDVYLRAFWDLSSERQMGFSIGPIPHSKILEHAGRIGLTGTLERGFVQILRALDRAYLEWVGEQSKRQGGHGQ